MRSSSLPQKIIQSEYERNLKSERHAFAGVIVITWRLNPPNVVD
jgi:hypothetical protein